MHENEFLLNAFAVTQENRVSVSEFPRYREQLPPDRLWQVSRHSETFSIQRWLYPVIVIVDRQK
ncbi:MAG: hypothetical protein JWM11_146 [Planctomycetaceae bacterium]|nr:hypothetical protein [Planctomycetaceae bacterium]